jgi:hypothetical protein
LRIGILVRRNFFEMLYSTVIYIDTIYDKAVRTRTQLIRL